MREFLQHQENLTADFHFKQKQIETGLEQLHYIQTKLHQQIDAIVDYCHYLHSHSVGLELGMLFPEIESVEQAARQDFRQIELNLQAGLQRIRQDYRLKSNRLEENYGHM
ncbi:hypothetical protein [Convivina intestini]|uniref:Uncharacterized protein n=1 Tax=Convivina intestini TaxID=1505726 RepID=A0A2U1D9M2_9LACO|nr:hypothetical protein [Convivina intestini]PVY84338.1 hypothetical protein C7384_10483 [Convivina intestini]CAH1857014.1 hypothetical protein R077811_01382 [Convivina intestini]SDC06302.1 hypothetical protein SAMN05216341_1118 [Leuconostocaceae bacterium R-53105]